MLNPAKITLNFRQHSHEDTKFGFLQTQKTAVMQFLVKFCFSCLVTFLREDRYECDVLQYFYKISKQYQAETQSKYEFRPHKSM